MKYLQELRKRILFLKINVSYLIIGMVLTLVFSFAVYRNMYNNTIKQVKSWNVAAQRQAISASDELIASLENYIGDVLRNDRLINLAMEIDDADRLQTYEITARLRDIQKSNALIYSLYLYNDKVGKVFGTEAPPAMAADFYDQPALQQIERREKGVNRFAVRELDTLIYETERSMNKRVITVVYYLHLENETDRSAMVVNLDLDTFSGIVLNSDISRDSTVLVFNGKGETVIGGTTGLTENQQVLTAVLKHNRLSGNFFLPINNDRSMVVYHYQNKLGWYYAFVNSGQRMLGNTQRDFRVFAVIIAAVILLLFVLSFFFSRIIYKPYRQLLGKMKSFVWHDGVNEIGYLDQSINHLLKKARKNNEIEQRQYVERLCRGELEDYAMQMTDDHFGHFFQGQFFRVVKVCFGQYYELKRKEGPEGIKLFQYMIKNVAEELFQETGNSLFFSLDDVTVDGIINSSARDNLAQMESVLSRLKEFVLANYGLELTFFLGEIVDGENIPRSYLQTTELYEHRLLGEGRMVNEYHDANLVFETYRYPRELEKSLFEALRLKHNEGVQKYSEKFLQALKNYPEPLIVTALVQLVGNSNRLLEDTSGVIHEEVFISYKKMQERLSDLQHYPAIAGWLQDFFAGVMEGIKDPKSQGSDVVADKIKKYIEANYKNPALSVEDIAEEVNFSTNYTRSLFKKQEQVGIGEYVFALRLEAICQELRTNDRPIRTICEENGIANVNYFFTAFKKKVGMTPDAYRKTHRG